MKKWIPALVGLAVGTALAAPSSLELRLQNLKQASSVDCLRQEQARFRSPSDRRAIRQALWEQAWRSPKGELREHCLEGLTEFCQESLAPAEVERFLPGLTHPEEDFRGRCWALFSSPGLLGSLNPSLRSRILALAEEPRGQIGLLFWSLEALPTRQMGPAEEARLLKFLRRSCQQPDPPLRFAALSALVALQSLHPDQNPGLQELQEHLGDPDPALRLRLLDLLARQGPSLQALKPALEARLRAVSSLPPPPGQEGEAFRLIQVLANVDSVPVEAWSYLQGPGHNQAPPLLMLQLAQLDPVGARPLITQILMQLSPQDLSLAAESLSWMGVDPPGWARWLKQLEPSQEPLMAIHALLGLTRSQANSPEVLQAIQSCLASPSDGVAVVAAYALSKLDPAGPGGAAAARMLAERPWKNVEIKPRDWLTTGCYALLAYHNLAPYHRFDPHRLERPDQPDLNALLGESGQAPPFVESFASSDPVVLGPDPAIQEFLALQVAWLAAHPELARPARPTLLTLARQSDPAHWQSHPLPRSQRLIYENNNPVLMALVGQALERIPATAEARVKVEILKAGQGKTLTPGQQATVHYLGRLPDGTCFDSSRKRGQPFTFRLGAHQVIPGWEEGVVGMKIGEKRRLTIPPQLAYGDKGVPPEIPPAATLIFEIELIRVAPQQ